MTFKDLAKKLVEAKTEAERMKIFEDVNKKDFLKLALELKEICYSSWTSEPTKAQGSAKALQSLYKISSQKEIEAISEWITGVAEITRGNLVSATKKLDNSAAIFLQINKEYEAAQTQVSKQIALAMLGKYAEAVETGKNALKIFEKYGDEIAAGKIENNIGNIFIRQELFQQSKKYYLSSQARFTRIKNAEELTVSEIGLANVYAAINDFRKAEKYFQKTLLYTQKQKMFLRQAEIENNIGNLALFRGKYNNALKYLEHSRQKFETLNMPHQTVIADLEIADVYLELNLATEAFEIYRRVTPQLTKLKIQGEQARSRAQFGRAAILLGDKPTARRELKKAAKLFQKENNLVGAAQVKLNEAQFELSQKKYKKALALAEETDFLLRKLDSKRHILSAQFIKGEALRNLGRFGEAETVLQQTLIKSIGESQLNTAWACQISLGKLALQDNQTEKAIGYFKKAIEQIENLRAPLPAEEFRMAFLANKLEPFEELARIYLKENNLEKAFEYLESARARTLSESLGAKTKEKEADDKVLAKLRKTLETLREELNWFYSRLSRADEKEFAELQKEADEREREIAVLTRQISALGEQAEIKTDKLDFAKLQTQLGAEKALIEFVCFDGEFSAVVVSREKIEFVRGLGSEEEITFWVEKLQFQFGAMSYGEKTVRNFVGELKKRTDLCLRKLYEKLIIPLEKFIGGKNLVIVPQKILHYVPFPALFDGENYLIESREIVFSPSATVWQFLTERKTKKSENALLIGFADEHIPNVMQEIEALQNVFKHSRTFTGEQATFSAFAENAEKFDVLHFACHGQFRPENPLFSSLHLADGFVTVRDICSYNLSAELVCLSACETGLSKVAAGEEILGLARGFLSAGAGSLVLSLWTVNDEATTRLMKMFYKELQRGASVSASLAEAQRVFVRENAHPYFWSPFILIGK